MVSRRKKRRKLKKTIKRILIAIPVLVIIGLILVYGFQLKTVGYTSDLNQFTAQEVQDYLKEQNVKNTLWFWLESVIGQKEEITMLEDYTVSINSPIKVTVHGKEKKLRSCIQYAENYFYMDSKGKMNLVPTLRQRRKRKNCYRTPWVSFLTPMWKSKKWFFIRN